VLSLSVRTGRGLEAGQGPHAPLEVKRFPHALQNPRGLSGPGRVQLGRAEGARGRGQRGPPGKPEEGKERREPVLIASDLDLSYLSRVYPGLGSRLGRCAARTLVRGVRGAYIVRVMGFGGSSYQASSSGILLSFFGTSLGSYPANRLVPPPRAL
jgi:hypothetical protein